MCESARHGPARCPGHAGELFLGPLHLGDDAPCQVFDLLRRGIVGKLCQFLVGVGGFVTGQQVT